MSMREAVTAGAVPTDVPSGRAMRPAHAYWRARTLRTQLLSLFILIELIAAAVAGAVSIFNARSATRVEIAASMELAELWVKEAVLLAQRETPADRFLADLASQLCRSPCAHRGEGRRRQCARRSSRRGRAGACWWRDRAVDRAALAGVGACAGMVCGAD